MGSKPKMGGWAAVLASKASAQKAKGCWLVPVRRQFFNRSSNNNLRIRINLVFTEMGCKRFSRPAAAVGRLFIATIKCHLPLLQKWTRQEPTRRARRELCWLDFSFFENFLSRGGFSCVVEVLFDNIIPVYHSHLLITLGWILRLLFSLL